MRKTYGIEERRIERSAPNKNDRSLSLEHKGEAVLHDQMRIRDIWGLYFYKPNLLNSII